VVGAAAVVPATVATPAAQAASGNPLVLSCLAHGDLAQNSADFSTLGPATYAGKKPGKGDSPIPNPEGTEPCSGDLATTTGDIAKVAFKLSGRASCASLWGDGTLNNFPAPVPMSGSVTITYANTNTATGKPWFTKAFVRLEPMPGPGHVDLPDAVHVDGQVFSGIGQGASLSTDMLMQPIPTWSTDRPTEAGGPTMDSYVDWFDPSAGPEPMPCTPAPGSTWSPHPDPYIRWDTDGAGLLSLTGDTNAVLHSAFQIDYTPQPQPFAPLNTVPLVSCEGFGKQKIDLNHIGQEGFGGSYKPGVFGSAQCDPSASLYSTTGTVTKETFKVLGTSPSTCGDATSPPLNGKLTLTYTNTNPATGKPYQSLAYVTTHPVPIPEQPEPCPFDTSCGQPRPTPYLPGEAECVTGVVDKGVGQGGDISGIILVHPVPTRDWDGNGKIDLPTPLSPTMDSYYEYIDTQTNPGQRNYVWTTGGPGYGTLLGNPNAYLQNRFFITPVVRNIPIPAACGKNIPTQLGYSNAQFFVGLNTGVLVVVPSVPSTPLCHPTGTIMVTGGCSVPLFGVTSLVWTNVNSAVGVNGTVIPNPSNDYYWGIPVSPPVSTCLDTSASYSGDANYLPSHAP
jgi:hypothetical protein